MPKSHLASSPADQTATAASTVLAAIHPKVRASIAVALATVILGAKASAQQAPENWMKDDRNGCAVLVPANILGRDAPGFGGSLLPSNMKSPTVRWNGPCGGGKAQGTGTLTFSNEGIELPEIAFTGANGQTMVDGSPTGNEAAIAGALRLSMAACKDAARPPLSFPGLRTVHGTVQPHIDLASHAVLRTVFAVAERFAWQACPLTRYRSLVPGVWDMSPGKIARDVDLGNTEVELFQGGQRQIRARSNERAGKTEWSGYSNRLRQATLQQTEQRLQAGRQQRVDEERRKRDEDARRQREAEETEARRQREAIQAEAHRRAEEKRLALVAKADASRKVFDAFQKRAGIAEWPNADNLRANPFVFRGRTVGVHAVFDAMLSQTEAMFTLSGAPAIVSRVPTTGFQRGGMPVLLAATVTGLRPIEILGTKLSAPHLEFVDVHVCAESDCQDVLFWAHQQQLR